MSTGDDRKDPESSAVGSSKCGNGAPACDATDCGKEAGPDEKSAGPGEKKAGPDEKRAGPDEKRASPFLAAEPKKGSPFLCSEPKKGGAAFDSEQDAAVEIATARKQHTEIDSMVEGKSIFNTVGKLYFLSAKTKRLETRGEGKITILRDATGLYKVLMIRDKVMLIGCNHYVAQSCPLTKATQVPRSWVWTALNDKSDAEVNDPKTTYFATFKTEEDAAGFFERYNEARDANAKAVAAMKPAKDGSNKEVL